MIYVIAYFESGHKFAWNANLHIYVHGFLLDVCSSYIGTCLQCSILSSKDMYHKLNATIRLDLHSNIHS
jgi:hypothetical protein